LDVRESGLSRKRSSRERLMWSAVALHDGNSLEMHASYSRKRVSMRGRSGLRRSKLTSMSGWGGVALTPHLMSIKTIHVHSGSRNRCGERGKLLRAVHELLILRLRCSASIALLRYRDRIWEVGLCQVACRILTSWINHVVGRPHGEQTRREETTRAMLWMSTFPHARGSRCPAEQLFGYTTTS